MREIIKVHCTAQEYWYIHRQHCECGGHYGKIMQALTRGPSGYVDRVTVRCKQCGGTNEYDFDVSTCGGPDYITRLTKKYEECSSVLSQTEIMRAFGPPMEAALGLASELADSGDELALDYLADAIAHAQSKLKDTPRHRDIGGDSPAAQPVGIAASISAAMGWIVDAVTHESYGHSEGVRRVASMIGEELELPSDELQSLEIAALVHDVGKLAVPEYILLKPVPLTEEEMGKVEGHSLSGAAILELLRFPYPVAPIVRSHHEWFDGTGYPDRLAGGQISLGARIISVADVYQALRSSRQYRDALTVQAASQYMRERSGAQFDPEVLDVFFRVLSAQSATEQYDAAIDESPEKQLPLGVPDRWAIFTEIQRAHRELLDLYHFAQVLPRSLRLQEMLDLVAARARDIFDSATSVVFLREAGSDDLTAKAASGPFSDVILNRRLPLGSGCSGRVAQGCRPSGLAQSAGDELVLLLGPSASGCALTEVLSAPLGSDRESIGALTLYRANDRPFSEDDARLLSAVSHQVAAAIRDARQGVHCHPACRCQPPAEPA